MLAHGKFNQLTKQVELCDLAEAARSGRWQHRTETTNGYVVSTVFLWCDRGFGGKPLWFETMIFENNKGGRFLDYQERYETYEEAMDGHHQAVLWALEQPEVKK